MSFRIVLLFAAAAMSLAACTRPESETVDASSGEPDSTESVLFERTPVDTGLAGPASANPGLTDDADADAVPAAPAHGETTQPAAAASQPAFANMYEIATPLGTMVVRLYDETPLHRDNFRKLVEGGVLDHTLFHRVINGFMVQGGDPNSKDGDPSNDGNGGPGYTIPAEFNDRFFHKRGALAAARQGDQFNPERASSGSQFYIVHGRVWTDEELTRMEEERDGELVISAEMRKFYTSEPGAPFLDGAYTVFGELVEGFDVLDALAGTETTGPYGRPANRPLTDVPMFVRPLSGYEQ